MQELEYYKAIVQSFSSGVVFQDHNLSIIYCNGSSERMLGLTKSQMMGKTSLDPDWNCIHDDGSPFPGEDHPATVCLKTGKSVRDVVMGVRKPNKAISWININAEPIFTEGGTSPSYIVTSFNDITVLKQKEEELEKSNEELQKFSYVASHDLQEPLRKINTFINIFMTKYGNQVDEKGKEYLDRVVNGSNRMKALIDDLLQYSKVGYEQEEMILLDCNDKVDYIIDLYAYYPIESRPIIVSQKLPKIKGYRTLLQSLFQNLIGNGIKYNENKIAHIDVSYTESDDDYTFHIKDDGIGIEPEYFKKIFQPFERLHGKSTYTGSGIGLAICKKIVDKHNGKIWVTSKLGEGSTFNFTIPK